MSVTLIQIREEEDQEICNSQMSRYGSDILFTVVLKSFILFHLSCKDNSWSSQELENSKKKYSWLKADAIICEFNTSKPEKGK